MVFTFSTHSVIVTGTQLGHFRSRLRDARITTLIESDPRYANLQTSQPFIGVSNGGNRESDRFHYQLIGLRRGLIPGVIKSGCDEIIICTFMSLPNLR